MAVGRFFFGEPVGQPARQKASFVSFVGFVRKKNEDKLKRRRLS